MDHDIMSYLHKATNERVKLFSISNLLTHRCLDEQESWFRRSPRKSSQKLAASMRVALHYLRRELRNPEPPTTQQISLTVPTECVRKVPKEEVRPGLRGNNVFAVEYRTFC